MALPDDFSPWQHLRQMLQLTHNANVEANFLGVPSDDISTPLGGMKVATLLQDDDTVDMTILRLFLYYFVFQANLPAPVYAFPPEDVFKGVRGHPQVILMFRETQTIEMKVDKVRPAESQITFRLMTYTPQTINPTYAKELAFIIKENLALGTPFAFERGTTKVSYKDTTNGYDFYLLVSSEAEGIRVIEKIVSLRGHPFEETNIIVHKDKKVYPADPGVAEVYGKSEKRPRLRPTTSVKFLRAELHIQGIKKPVLLVSKAGHGNPLYSF